MNRKKVRVGLLSHYFRDDNLGCVALSVSNVRLLDQAAAQAGVDISYRILVNEKHPDLALEFTTSPYEYVVYSSAKQTLRHPVRLLKGKYFEGLDCVININAGDGFTDLYGFPRLLAETYMSSLALLRKCPVVVAPQTIGPFGNGMSRLVASNLLRRSRLVFARDQNSFELSCKLGARRVSHEVIDVAFALPFERPARSGGARVGVNVSGLLYRGGYNRSNYFGLAFDYREFVDELVMRLVDVGARVHLISHVAAEDGTIEDDYSACEEVAQRVPEVILAPRFTDPVEAKSYISGLDYFTGARMHATIAAISAGVAVAPIGYSKKLPGLFDTLEYPYYIDAREPRWDASGAAGQVVEWYHDRDVLACAARDSARVYEPRLQSYRNALATLLTSVPKR